jgi:hypothetical protein
MSVRIEIVIPGDRSVGIDDQIINMEIVGTTHDFLDGYDNGGREAFRLGLKEWAITWFDTVKAEVRFNDECGDCGKRTAKDNLSVCLDLNCPSNL